ncbi:toprim domain-containing protein [Arachidicoccus terrestris]|uniref:toprim domain-containing protein n=1 Tax=Arachidicoccus terrestris TaxID=2875539 RepID=UPI001CC5886B|nr:toprim domain-containing protein [Arachidicoccus terrestris]UAY55674.1 toprim domain-containing protein [Arachidicoccus terrestris]
MTIKEAKELDIVIYLLREGIQPIKIKGNNYWYYSPFRNERTPSFKVNRARGLWYDFGEGLGGAIIDLGIRLHGLSVAEFLTRLEEHGLTGGSFSFDQERTILKRNAKLSALKILSVHPVQSESLIRYLAMRNISKVIADKYLVEVRYQYCNRSYFALGFQNDKGGYKLRSPIFKGSSSPKSVTFLNAGVSQIAVFEGAFDFLSFLCFRAPYLDPAISFLILNSLSFFENRLTFLQQFETVDLYLDNDEAGDKMTSAAVCLNNKLFFDKRSLFKGFKDLNDWWARGGPRIIGLPIR